MSTPYRRNAKTPAGRIAATPSTANWGGFFGLLQEYAGAAAGYSLRKIGSGPVVRLRRASDNAEKDFYAGEVVAGTAGAEELTNGDFSNGSTGWSLTGFTIVGGQAVADAGGGLDLLSQFTLDDQQAGDAIVVTFDVVTCSDFTNAGLQINSTFLKSFSNMQITSTGTYSLIYYYGSKVNNRFRFYATNSATLTVDNVSVKPYVLSAAEAWAANGKDAYYSQTAESAFCTTWYDQSASGNNATQATAAAQPLLIRAGVTNTAGGKAALEFDGVDDYLDITTNPLTVLNNLMVSIVAKPLPSSGHFGVTLSETAERIYVPFIDSSNLYISYDDSVSKIDDGAPTNDQQLITLSVDASTASGFKNGAAFSVTPTATAETAAVVETTNVPQIGAYGGGSNWDGTFQEVIIYASDQSANRTGIETNINDHYGIY
jgi:hypothetical protein